jgi:cobyrinic acid a,c-diamide synthase
MPEDVRLLSCLPRQDDMVLPHRHLGLINPNEVSDIEQRLDTIADVIADSDLAKYKIPPVEFESVDTSSTLNNNHLDNLHIAIAKDEAFSFIYAGNVRLLESLGAKLSYFSPLHDAALPANCNALWLPGGYPELHMEALQNNQAMHTAIKQHFNEDKVILAECGGMLYAQNTLTDLDGNTATMLGLISGKGMMRNRGGCQGMQAAPLPEGEIRGHAHHRSYSEETETAIAHGRRAKHSAPGEKIIRKRGLTASYLHLYFPSNPKATCALFKPKNKT